MLGWLPVGVNGWLAVGVGVGDRLPVGVGVAGWHGADVGMCR